jgi:IclR family acetate operon transcriptional repressor
MSPDQTTETPIEAAVKRASRRPDAQPFPKKAKAVAAAKRPAAAGAAPERRRYHSRAVAKALEVVEILKKNPNPVGLHRLSKQVGLTKASLLRILDTLEACGYLERRASGEYSLTPDMALVPPAGWISRLLRVAMPQLKELTRQIKESSALACLFANHIEVIGVCESPQTVRMGNTVGRILQPHASSLGKAITAFQPVERRESLLRSYGIFPMTPKTITDETEIHEEFRRIREQGYAMDDEETTLGGRCFGAPILTPWGDVRAAISISVPKIRVGSAAHQQKLIDAVTEAAAGISRELAVK